MSIDPYDNMPSKEDLRTSGAADWLNDVVAEQKKRQAALKAALGGEKAALQAQRQDLENLLNLPPEEVLEEGIPDLFASERQQVAKKKAQLSALVDDLGSSKAAEKAVLKDLFGDL